MKTRNYKSTDDRMYCPNCNKQITSNIQGLKNVINSGVINIVCQNCGKGQASISNNELVKRE